MNFEEILAFATRSPFNQMLSLALVGLTVAIVYTEISRLFRGYKTLRPAELTQLVNSENALVVEVNLVEVLRVRTVVIAGKAPLEAQAMPGKTGAQENAGTKQPQSPAKKNESVLHGALGKISLPF